MVVNNSDYRDLCLVGRSNPGLGTSGARLSNRLCIVNADATARTAYEQKVNFEDLLNMVGTYEIVHTLTYQETWIEIMNTPSGRFLINEDKIQRRDGI